MPPLQDELRQLPSVEEVLSRLAGRTQAFPRALVVAETRRALEELRQALRAGHDADLTQLVTRIEAALQELTRPSLRRVINATGVVLHTNLGRAPLAPFEPVAGYSNLEFDLETGKRGKRDVHTSPLLERLLGVPAIAVNNNAAAVFLALHELAAGQEVIVSRGELIEIGDSFRIPDIMARAGAVLREVGTTNRTRIEDYRQAITERTRLLLRVHPSNFRIEGFTAKPELAELVALGRERGIPVYEDIGSGCLMDLRPLGISEPLVQDSIRAGVDLISFSTDKLLGGPQAGILAGRPELTQRLRRNPLYRALRLDKLLIQSLEHTLRQIVLERWEQIPALRMMRLSPAVLRDRAERLAASIAGLHTEVMAGESVIGGGSTPAQVLPTWLIALQGGPVHQWEATLRRGKPAVIARLERDRLLIDLRTVEEEEEPELLAALQALSM